MGTTMILHEQLVETSRPLRITAQQLLEAKYYRVSPLFLFVFKLSGTKMVPRYIKHKQVPKQWSGILDPDQSAITKLLLLGDVPRNYSGPESLSAYKGSVDVVPDTPVSLAKHIAAALKNPKKLAKKTDRQRLQLLVNLIGPQALSVSMAIKHAKAALRSKSSMAGKAKAGMISTYGDAWPEVYKTAVKSGIKPEGVLVGSYSPKSPGQPQSAALAVGSPSGTKSTPQTASPRSTSGIHKLGRRATKSNSVLPSAAIALLKAAPSLDFSAWGQTPMMNKRTTEAAALVFKVSVDDVTVELRRQLYYVWALFAAVSQSVDLSRGKPKTASETMALISNPKLFSSVPRSALWVAYSKAWVKLTKGKSLTPMTFWASMVSSEGLSIAAALGTRADASVIEDTPKAEDASLVVAGSDLSAFPKEMVNVYTHTLFSTDATIADFEPGGSLKGFMGSRHPDDKLSRYYAGLALMIATPLIPHDYVLKSDEDIDGIIKDTGLATLLRISKADSRSLVKAAWLFGHGDSFNSVVNTLELDDIPAAVQAAYLTDRETISLEIPEKTEVSGDSIPLGSMQAAGASAREYGMVIGYPLNTLMSAFSRESVVKLMLEIHAKPGDANKFKEQYKIKHEGPDYNGWLIMYKLAVTASVLAEMAKATPWLDPIYPWEDDLPGTKPAEWAAKVPKPLPSGMDEALLTQLAKHTMTALGMISKSGYLGYGSQEEYLKELVSYRTLWLPLFDDMGDLVGDAIKAAEDVAKQEEIGVAAPSAHEESTETLKTMIQKADRSMLPKVVGKWLESGGFNYFYPFPPLSTQLEKQMATHGISYQPETRLNVFNVAKAMLAVSDTVGSLGGDVSVQAIKALMNSKGLAGLLGVSLNVATQLAFQVRHIMASKDKNPKFWQAVNYFDDTFSKMDTASLLAGVEVPEMAPALKPSSRALAFYKAASLAFLPKVIRLWMKHLKPVGKIKRTTPADRSKVTAWSRKLGASKPGFYNGPEDNNLKGMYRTARALMMIVAATNPREGKAPSPKLLGMVLKDLRVPQRLGVTTAKAGQLARQVWVMWQPSKSDSYRSGRFAWAHALLGVQLADITPAGIQHEADADVSPDMELKPSAVTIQIGQLIDSDVLDELPKAFKPWAASLVADGAILGVPPTKMAWTAATDAIIAWRDAGNDYDITAIHSIERLTDWARAIRATLVSLTLINKAVAFNTSPAGVVSGKKPHEVTEALFVSLEISKLLGVSTGEFKKIMSLTVLISTFDEIEGVNAIHKVMTLLSGVVVPLELTTADLDVTAADIASDLGAAAATVGNKPAHTANFLPKHHKAWYLFIQTKADGDPDSPKLDTAWRSLILGVYKAKTNPSAVWKDLVDEYDNITTLMKIHRVIDTSAGDIPNQESFAVGLIQTGLWSKLGLPSIEVTTDIAEIIWAMSQPESSDSLRTQLFKDITDLLKGSPAVMDAPHATQHPKTVVTPESLVPNFTKLAKIIEWALKLNIHPWDFGDNWNLIKDTLPASHQQAIAEFGSDYVAKMVATSELLAVYRDLLSPNADLDSPKWIQFMVSKYKGIATFDLGAVYDGAVKVVDKGTKANKIHKQIPWMALHDTLDLLEWEIKPTPELVAAVASMPPAPIATGNDISLSALSHEVSGDIIANYSLIQNIKTANNKATADALPAWALDNILSSKEQITQYHTAQFLVNVKGLQILKGMNPNTDAKDQWRGLTEEFGLTHASQDWLDAAYEAFVEGVGLEMFPGGLDELADLVSVALAANSQGAATDPDSYYSMYDNTPAHTPQLDKHLSIDLGDIKPLGLFPPGSMAVLASWLSVKSGSDPISSDDEANLDSEFGPNWEHDLQAARFAQAMMGGLGAQDPSDHTSMLTVDFPLSSASANTLGALVAAVASAPEDEKQAAWNVYKAEISQHIFDEGSALGANATDAQKASYVANKVAYVWNQFVPDAPKEMSAAATKMGGLDPATGLLANGKALTPFVDTQFKETFGRGWRLKVIGLSLFKDVAKLQAQGGANNEDLQVIADKYKMNIHTLASAVHASKAAMDKPQTYKHTDPLGKFIHAIVKSFNPSPEGSPWPSQLFGLGHEDADYSQGNMGALDNPAYLKGMTKITQPVALDAELLLASSDVALPVGGGFESPFPFDGNDAASFDYLGTEVGHLDAMGALSVNPYTDQRMITEFTATPHAAESHSNLASMVFPVEAYNPVMAAKFHPEAGRPPQMLGALQVLHDGDGFAVATQNKLMNLSQSGIDSLFENFAFEFATGCISTGADSYVQNPNPGYEGTVLAVGNKDPFMYSLAGLELTAVGGPSKNPLYIAAMSLYQAGKITPNFAKMGRVFDKISAIPDDKWLEAMSGGSAEMRVGGMSGEAVTRHLQQAVAVKNTAKAAWEAHISLHTPGGFSFATVNDAPVDVVSAAEIAEPHPPVALEASGLVTTMDGFQPPKFEDMTRVSQSSVGLPDAGAGKKSFFKDKGGTTWMFKPAKRKDGKVDPCRAPMQEAFARIAAKVRPLHVPVVQVTLHTPKGATFGTLQPVADLAANPTLRDPKKPNKLADPKKLSDSERQDIASEHVLDWLFGQHDSHEGNFIRVNTSHGTKIIGIDKEQGGRWLQHSTHADRLATDYKPNSVHYDEKEPFYNVLWRGFAAGDFSMKSSFKEMKRTLEAIEAIPMDEFLKDLDTYAGFVAKGDLNKKAEIISRFKLKKNTLRGEFERFLTEQHRIKLNDHEGLFTFATGWVDSEIVAKGKKGRYVTPDTAPEMYMWTIQDVMADNEWQRLPFHGKHMKALESPGSAKMDPKDYVWITTHAVVGPDTKQSGKQAAFRTKITKAFKEFDIPLVKIDGKVVVSINYKKSSTNNHKVNKHMFVLVTKANWDKIQGVKVKRDTYKSRFTAGIVAHIEGGSLQTSDVPKYNPTLAASYRSNASILKEVVPSRGNSPRVLADYDDNFATTIPRGGLVLRSDSDLLEGQQMRVRVRQDDDFEDKYYAVDFRLREKLWRKIQAAEKSAGVLPARQGRRGDDKVKSKFATYDDHTGTYKSRDSSPAGAYASRFKTNPLVWKTKLSGASKSSIARLDIPVPGSSGKSIFSIVGRVQCDLSLGPSQSLKQGLAEMLGYIESTLPASTGISKALKEPTAKDAERRMMMAILQARKPKWYRPSRPGGQKSWYDLVMEYGVEKAKEIRKKREAWEKVVKKNKREGLSDAQIKAAFKELKIVTKETPNGLTAFKEVESLSGHHAIVQRGRWREVKSEAGAGLMFLVWSHSSLHAIFDICTKGAYGVLERIEEGIGILGSSAPADVRTGAANNITMRVVTEFQRNWALKFGLVSGPYAAIIAPSVVDRLDAIFYNADEFGRQHGDAYDKRPEVITALTKSLVTDKSHKSSSGAGGTANKNNEIVLRKGVSASQVLRVGCNASLRPAAIKHFADRGVYEVNGIPIEHFFVEEKTCGAVYDRFVKPEGY